MNQLLIIVPESLVDQANHLARAIGNIGNAFVVKYTKAGQVFYACNFGAVPAVVKSWIQSPFVPLEIPDTVNRSKCNQALAAIGTDILVIEHSGNPAHELAQRGYSLMSEDG